MLQACIYKNNYVLSLHGVRLVERALSGGYTRRSFWQRLHRLVAAILAVQTMRPTMAVEE